MNVLFTPCKKCLLVIIISFIMACGGTKVIKKQDMTTIKYGDPKIVISFPRKWNVQQSIDEDRLSVILNVETYKVKRGNDGKNKPGVNILLVVDKEHMVPDENTNGKISYKNFILQSFRTTGKSSIAERKDVIAIIKNNTSIPDSEAWAFQITDRNEQKKMLIFGLQLFKEGKSMTVFFQTPVESFNRLKQEFVEIIRSIRYY